MATCTHTDGPSIVCSKPITTNMLIRIPYELKKIFGEGFDFIIEPITEGGIRWIKWPGYNSDKQYKSFRFDMWEYGEFPLINDQILSTWENDEQIIWSYPVGKLRGYSLLKAFYGAPIWTLDEIRKFKQAFALVGIELKCGKIRKKDLCLIGSC